MNIEELAKTSDLGINAHYLYDCVKQFENGIFIDLGVRTGVSSQIMLNESENKNNKVFGVDVDSSLIERGILLNPNYTFMLADSVTAGKQWENGKINILFIDTFHIKEQVMTELYYWYPHVLENSYIIFHDSNWPEGKHDVYGGISWPRVEEGIKHFFKIEELNYEDKYIKVSNYPESWGMTIVKIKEKKDYISLYKKWKDIFDKRNHLISLFWNKENSKNINIELNITL
jgi:hypothetical protein